MFHYWIPIITNQTKSKKMKKEIKRQEEKNPYLSFNLLLNSKEIEYLSIASKSSIETKICSKTALKSKSNQNLQKNWKNRQSRERNPMTEALQSSRSPLYLKHEYIYGPRVKWA